jgi:hypothetical protein
MFYRNTQESNSKIDIWKEKNTENSSPLINNKRIAVRTRLFIAFLALAIISSVLIISHTQNEVLAKKTTGNKSGIDGGDDAGSLSGNNTSDTTSSNSTSSSPSGGNTSASELNTVASVDETHCDKKGYPSCYDLGYSDGQNAPGTSCPSGHSEAYCNGYEAASVSGNSSSDVTSSIKQNSKVNQAGQSNSNIDVTNSPDSKVNNKSTISNNANEKSTINNGPFVFSPSITYPGPSSPFPLNQNSKTTINQGAVNNADINVNNSPGTRITNEQTIKQSVRINNEVNNIIRNSQVNKIIKENTVSAPQQPLTDLLTIKLAESSMSSGSLFPLADVEPYRVIGGHITANLPSSSQQNIVVAQISDGEIQHAVILDLKQIIGSNLDQNSLYETSLGSDISGTNPFTGNPDEVSSITNLFLWNNNQQTIVFDNANAVTINLIYR